MDFQPGMQAASSNDLEFENINDLTTYFFLQNSIRNTVSNQNLIFLYWLGGCNSYSFCQ